MSHRKRQAASRQVMLDRGIPDTLSFEDLVTLVGVYRGTKIVFQENPKLNGTRVCGAWTGAPGVDTVHLPSDAQLESKMFIALHELGHMLAEEVGSETRVGDSPEIRDFLSSVMNPDRIVAYAFKGARDYTDEREALAETIGDQLALRILRSRRKNRSRDFKFEQVFAG